MYRKILIIFATVALTAALFGSHCDRDKDNGPTGPQPPPEDSRHLFYVAAREGGLIKVFWAEARAFVDSIIVNKVQSTEHMKLHVIGDYEKLSVSTESQTYIIDLETKEIIDSLNATEVYWSPDSRYYSFLNHISGRLELYSWPEKTLVFDEDPHFPYVQISNDGKYMSYAIYYGGPEDLHNKLVRYDIEENKKVDRTIYRYQNESYILPTYPSSKFKKTFLDAHSYSGSFMGVVDFDSDTARVLMFNPYAVFFPVISYDERFLYFSPIIGEIWGYPTEYKIHVYDVENEDSIATISFVDHRFEPGHFVISCDRKYLLARKYQESSEFPPLRVCLVDAKRYEIIDFYDFDGPLMDIATKRVP